MGISIHAIVDPTCFSRSTWNHLYEETVTVLRAWPDPPIRPCHTKIAGVEVPTYTRDVIDPDGWEICGDANSRLTAESIELPRELGVDTPRPPRSEIVLRVLATQQAPYDDEGLTWLLHNKTQGKPFHALVLAIAMLIEHRLPHAAFAGGDFEPDDARQAQAQLQAILGELVALPLCAEPPRLRERLRPHLEGRALERATKRACSEGWGCHGSTAATLLGLLTGSAGSRLRQEVEQAVACTDVSQLSEPTREAFESFITQGDALFDDGPGRTRSGAEISAKRQKLVTELSGLDARRLLQTIACRTRTGHLALTEMAWADIEAASLPELRFLAALARRTPTELVRYQLCRACFESVAIRRFCLHAWDTIPASPRANPRGTPKRPSSASRKEPPRPRR
jgi:hypothetical protein